MLTTYIRFYFDVAVFFFLNERSVELAFKRCLDSRFLTFCPDYARKQRLKDDIQKAVSSFLRGRRFFCSQDINFRTIDLDIKVRPLFPCDSQFLPEMEKCALPLRDAYRLTQNITAAQLCRYFQCYEGRPLLS